MAIIVPTADRIGTGFQLQTPEIAIGDTLFLREDFAFVSTDDHAVFSSGVAEYNYIIDGDIIGALKGIDHATTTVFDVTVSVGSSGRISSVAGVGLEIGSASSFVAGSNAAVNTAGTINSRDDMAVWLNGAETATVSNSGHIYTNAIGNGFDNAVRINRTLDASLTNSGIIETSNRFTSTSEGIIDDIAAVSFSTGEASSVGTIDNSGTISGPSHAIFSELESTSLVNTGTISGDILFGSATIAHDVLNTGTINGDFDSGAFDSTFTSSGTINGTIQVEGQGARISNLQDGVITAQQTAILTTATEARIVNDGAIVAGGVGIIVGDTGNNIVRNSGTIDAQSIGIIADGDSNVILNSGEISSADNVTLQIFGASNRIVNSGSLSSSNNAVYIEGDASRFINSGTIGSNGQIAVQFENTSLSDIGVFVNSGAVQGTTFAFASTLTGGDIAVVNSGEMIGSVQLGVGNDTFDGRGGTVLGSVLGGSGDDTFVVDDSSLELLEGAGQGTDTVRTTTDWELGANFENLQLIGDGDTYAFGNGDANEITGNTGNNDIFGGGLGDTIDGRAGDDRLNGGNGDDAMNGGDGDDSLNGSNGDDILRGQNGEDIIYGGAGRDILSGDLGSLGGFADRFLFRSITESTNDANADRIGDFIVGEDTLDLRRIDADTATGADDAFTFIGAVGFSSTAGELRATLVGSNTIVLADVDGDSIADFRIILTNGAAVVEGDFLL